MNKLTFKPTSVRHQTSISREDIDALQKAAKINDRALAKICGVTPAAVCLWKKHGRMTTHFLELLKLRASLAKIKEEAPSGEMIALSTISTDALVVELRRRGFSGTLSSQKSISV